MTYFQVISVEDHLISVEDELFVGSGESPLGGERAVEED